MATFAAAHAKLCRLRLDIARIEGRLADDDRLAEAAFVGSVPGDVAAEERMRRKSGGRLALGIAALDAVLGGGLPLAALTEIRAVQSRDGEWRSGFQAIRRACVAPTSFWSCYADMAIEQVETGAGAVALTGESAGKAVATAKAAGGGNDLKLQLDYATKTEGAYPIVARDLRDRLLEGAAGRQDRTGEGLPGLLRHPGRREEPRRHRVRAAAGRGADQGGRRGEGHPGIAEATQTRRTWTGCPEPPGNLSASASRTTECTRGAYPSNRPKRSRMSEQPPSPRTVSAPDDTTTGENRPPRPARRSVR